MIPSIVPPSTTGGVQFALSYPAIGFGVIIAIYLLYRYLKNRRLKANIDDGWLDDMTMTD